MHLSNKTRNHQSDLRRLICSAACFCLLIGTANPLSAQETSAGKAATSARWSQARLFKRAPAEQPTTASVTKPTPLHVVDRQAAQQPQPNRPQFEPTQPQPNRFESSQRRYPAPVQPATPVDSSRAESGATLASYQQPVARVYTNPAPRTNSVDGYESGPIGFAPAVYPPAGYPPPPNYFPPVGPAELGYPVPAFNQPTLPHENFAPGANYLNAPPHNPMRSVQDPAQPFLDEANSAEPYPALDSDYANQLPYADPQPPMQGPINGMANEGAYASPQHPYGFETGNAYATDGMGGRGYLQNGTTLQGRRLNLGPPTATERALELKTENDRLREAMTRTQLELDNRTKELAAARTAFTNKEEELVRTINKVNDLNAQIVRLNSELKVANVEKEAIQRRSDAQLKAIESSLDSVLMNSISQTGDRK